MAGNCLHGAFEKFHAFRLEGVVHEAAVEVGASLLAAEFVKPSGSVLSGPLGDAKGHGLRLEGVVAPQVFGVKGVTGDHDIQLLGHRLILKEVMVVVPEPSDNRPIGIGCAQGSDRLQVVQHVNQHDDDVGICNARIVLAAGQVAEVVRATEEVELFLHVFGKNLADALSEDADAEGLFSAELGDRASDLGESLLVGLEYQVATADSSLLLHGIHEIEGLLSLVLAKEGHRPIDDIESCASFGKAHPQVIVHGVVQGLVEQPDLIEDALGEKYFGLVEIIPLEPVAENAGELRRVEIGIASRGFVDQ